MTTYSRLRTTRRLVWAGIALFGAVATAISIVRIVGSEPRTLGDDLGSMALGFAFALPAFIAWTSLDRRPELLGAAGFSALIVSVIGIVTLPLGILTALLWRRAAERRPQTSHVPWRRLAFPALTVLAVMVLFVHVDPVCTETYADGRTVGVDASSQGFETGWSLSFGGTVSSSGASAATEGGAGAQEVVSSECVSDTIVVGEAIASLAVSSATVALARRWPVRQRGLQVSAEATTMEV